MGKPFEKGDSRINRSGRPKAISDKAIAQARKKLLEIFLENVDSLSETLQEIDKPEQFVTAMIALGKMVIPIPKPFDFDEPAVVKRLQAMTDDELDILINEILKHHQNGQVNAA